MSFLSQVMDSILLAGLTTSPVLGPAGECASSLWDNDVAAAAGILVLLIGITPVLRAYVHSGERTSGIYCGLGVMGMPMRKVELGQHQHKLVDDLVASGRYQNASEVFREGLRLVEQRDAEDAAKLAVLRAAVDRGWADVAAGRFIDVNANDLDDVIEGIGAQTPNDGR